MKIIKQDLRKGEFVIKSEDNDDLWELSNFIEENDIAKGKATRKISLGKDVIKKTITATIKIEKVKFESDILRLNGILLSEHEDIAKSSYQSISLGKDEIITIQKEKILKYYIDKINKAANRVKSNILIASFDKDEALILEYNLKTFKVLYNLKSISSGKQYIEKQKSNFFDEISQEIEKLFKQTNYDILILASPGFWKSKVSELLKNNELIKRKIIETNVSNISISGISEILQDQNIKNLLKNSEEIKDRTYVELLLTEIGKDGLYSYGYHDVKERVEQSNIDTLLITTKYSRENKENQELMNLLRYAENLNSIVHFVDSSNQAGIKLDSLGGIAGILRYKT